MTSIAIYFSVALTDGKYVNVDSDDQTVLNTEGLLSRYYNGAWHVQCLEAEILANNTVTSTIGQNLCEYLGFAYVHLDFLLQYSINFHFMQFSFKQFPKCYTMVIFG